MDQALIDKIVRNVLTQLQSESVRSVTTTSAIATSTVAASTTSRVIAKSAALELTAAVITAEYLEEHVTKGQSLKIGRRSIVTPSAWDWLKTHRIDWSRTDRHGNSGNNPATGGKWKLIVRITTPAVQALHDSVNKQMTGWRSELASSETNVSNLAIQSISTEGVWGVAVISDAADLVACRLNRNEVVRAARIENRQQLEHAQRLMGINVCCIHPSGKTFIEMRNLLNAFGSIRPVVPANW